MRKRNPESPWNPGAPVEVTPTEYEEQVLKWLQAQAGALADFEIRHAQHLAGAGGEYEFDVVAEFTAFEGARIVVLVECKRHRSPIKREVVLALHSKLSDVGAHKGMIFSAAGFQRGAIEYASAHGIATVTFIDGRWTYETRAVGGPTEPPPWVHLPRFAGWQLTLEEGAIHGHLIADDHLRTIQEWLLT